MKRTFPTIMIIFILAVSACLAQDDSLGIDSLRIEAPNIFVDCGYCDGAHLREELTFINFVRDRKQADVHILVTRQTTGSGGDEYTFEFIGQRGFDGMADTLRLYTRDADSWDMVREEMARTMKAGLVRYVARTPVGKHLTIGYTESTDIAEAVDKWDYWVFEIDGSCYFNGQSSYQYLSLWGEVSAERVTEQSRISIELWGNYQEEKYKAAGFLDKRKTKGGSGSVIWSLTDHWSAGVWAEGYSSVYGNKRFQSWNAPAIEYNLYPYSESTQRQLRFQYWLAVIYNDYYYRTIYEKKHEWLGMQRVRVTLELTRPWGSAEMSLTGSHYLHDIKKNHLRLHSGLSLRLFEGFSLNLSGSYSRVSDQISLVKGGLSEAQIIARIREMETSYDSHMSIGVSYSFGSIYNNIVNPRFGH